MKKVLVEIDGKEFLVIPVAAKLLVKIIKYVNGSPHKVQDILNFLGLNDPADPEKDGRCDARR